MNSCSVQKSESVYEKQQGCRGNLFDAKIPFGVSDIFLTLTHRHTYTGGHLRPQGSVNNMDYVVADWSIASLG